VEVNIISTRSIAWIHRVESIERDKLAVLLVAWVTGLPTLVNVARGGLSAQACGAIIAQNVIMEVERGRPVPADVRNITAIRRNFGIQQGMVTTLIVPVHR